MSWNASAGAAGEDTTLKTLTCLQNADPNDDLVREIKSDLAVASSILEMMKDYMALLRDNFNNDAPPFRKMAKLFELGATFDALDGHYYGICPGLRTGDLQGVAAEYGNLLGFIWSSAIVGHCPWAGKSFSPMNDEDRARIVGDTVPPDVQIVQGINHFNRIEGAPVNVATVALLNFMWHLTKATDDEKQQYGYDYKGGIIASHRAPSIYPGTPREVFRLNYRYAELPNYPPLSFLIDEMVQIGDGMYLGQAIFATTKWLDRFDPKADPAEYHYQNFGYFLLFEPFWNAEAKRLFPFLEMPDVALPVEVPKVSGGPSAAPAAAPDKFATLTLADPVDGDVDSAQLNRVRADIQSNGDIIRTLKSYSDELTAEHKTDSPVFDKLHTLFNAGMAPQTMDGFYHGALISWQSQGFLAPFRENVIGVAWQASRFFSPWIGKDFHQIDEAELARWTEGGEPMGSDPAYNCSNTVVWRTMKQKFTREVSKLAGVRIEDATPEETEKYGYDAHTFFFIGRPNKTSMLTENKGKQVYQFNYRWKPLRNIPPDCFCIDEIVQIADGLYLGQLIYATDWLKAWSPATPIEEYKYRLFGYFLLMDEEWHQRRLRIGFDLQDT